MQLLPCSLAHFNNLELQSMVMAASGSSSVLASPVMHAGMSAAEHTSLPNDSSSAHAS